MAQVFKINVISLAHQRDRREKMCLLLENSEREWAFVDAISGNDIAPYAHLYDRQRRLKVLGYDMKPNEIACVLSHRQAWENCVRDGVPYLVLEDDVLVATPFEDFNATVPVADAICHAMGDALFARLGNSRARGMKVDVHAVGHGIDVVRYEKDPLSSFAYLLSPQIARQLLRGSERFFVPVDNFMWRGWEHGCCMYDVNPHVMTTSDVDNPSSIGDRRKPRIGLARKARREYYRFFDNKDKLLYEQTMLKKHKKQ